MDVAEKVYEWLVERRAERGHTIIAVGGGVVGDLAGFVAATFLRGMPFVQVPTSMAAMVDASIGGKVAVNLPQGKNLVGAFYQPKAVLADASALSSLGTRELAEGWAEAIKHGLILDSELFDLFEEHAESLAGLNDESTGGDVRELAVPGHQAEHGYQGRNSKPGRKGDPGNPDVAQLRTHNRPRNRSRRRIR